MITINITVFIPVCDYYQPCIVLKNSLFNSYLNTARLLISQETIDALLQIAVFSPNKSCVLQTQKTFFAADIDGYD